MITLNGQDFLKEMQGDWTSQKTIYYIKTKKIYNYKSKLKIIRNKNNKIPLSIQNKRSKYQYNAYNFQYDSKQYESLLIANNKIDNFTGILQKIVGQISQNYQFQINQNHYLKIKSRKDNIIYTEYIYYISDNLRISITKLKRLNNYIAITFTSYIKIIKSNQ